MAKKEVEVQAMTEAPETGKERKRLPLTDLSALKTQTTELVIKTDDETVDYVVTIGDLSFGEFNRIAREYNNPAPPKTGVDRNGRPVQDFADPTYRAQLAAVDNQRLYHMVAVMIDRGGEMTIPGDDIAEKKQWVEDNLNRDIMVAFDRYLNMLGTEEGASIEKRANSFQSNGSQDASDTGKAGA